MLAEKVSLCLSLVFPSVNVCLLSILAGTGSQGKGYECFHSRSEGLLWLQGEREDLGIDFFTLHHHSAPALGSVEGQGVLGMGDSPADFP